MKPLKARVSITLDSNIIERIRELFELEDRSFSQHINLILKRHIEEIDNGKETKTTYGSLR